MDTEVEVGTVETPWGSFGAALSEIGLARLAFPAEQSDVLKSWVASRMPEVRRVVRDDLRLQQLATELEAYFRGTQRAFAFPLDPQGTPFQLKVWGALQEIPYGETRTYREIARAIGRPRAVRAIGAANGANPVPILIPCHRVIGSDGTLTGYAGGLGLKRRLLELENAY